MFFMDLVLLKCNNPGLRSTILSAFKMQSFLSRKMGSKLLMTHLGLSKVWNVLQNVPNTTSYWLAVANHDSRLTFLREDRPFNMSRSNFLF